MEQILQYIGVVLGFYWDNGKGNGNHYSRFGWYGWMTFNLARDISICI